jgi:hypothetical protein
MSAMAERTVFPRISLPGPAPQDAVYSAELFDPADELRIPLDVDAPAKGVHRHRAGMRHQRSGFGFTLRVRDRIGHRDLLAAIFQPLGSREARCNCSFWAE